MFVFLLCVYSFYVCIHSMLHGCEVWYELHQYEFDMLERTQCRSFRTFQGLPPRTHNTIARGLLGELSILSRIQLMKLNFLQRLVMANPFYLIKRVFIKRLYDSMHTVSMKGFIPDIVKILDNCGLKSNLTNYALGGRFPSKLDWKSMSRYAVVKSDTDYNRHSLSLKGDSDRYIRVACVIDNLSMNPFYTVIKRGIDRQCAKQQLTFIKLLSLPSTSYEKPVCKLCQKDYMTVCTPFP